MVNIKGAREGRDAVRERRHARAAAPKCSRNLRPSSSFEGRTMAKLKFIVVILAASMASIAAYGQDNGGGLVAPELSKPTPGHLLDQDYLTSTGETVPRPGASQSAGPTPLDRKIEQQDNKIDNSICTGC
jgi:hypothetical protein